MTQTRNFAAHSYSQVAEDLLIAYLLGTDRGLRYIDVGCLWPVQHSNTYLFYAKGGAGACIDANPDAAADFEAERPRDVFLNAALGAEEGTMTYYRFDNPSFNTFSKARMERLRAQAAKRPGRALLETVEVPVITLDAALAKLDPPRRSDGRVDLLSIDVEGLELDVLRSFGFEPKPRLVVCEQLRRGGKPSPESVELNELMAGRGYWLAAYTGHDAFYLADDA